LLPKEMTASLPYVFVPRLLSEYANKLQQARASKVVNNPGSSVELTWEDIIAVAKDDQYGVKLAIEEKVNVPARTTHNANPQ
jgi:hypothetical protein